MPGVGHDGVQRQALGDLRRRHGALHVLFVGQNENGCVLQVLGEKKQNKPKTGRASVTSYIHKAHVHKKKR